MMNLALELYLFTTGCDFSEFRDILRHETDCFAAVLPHPKEGVLRIFIALKTCHGKKSDWHVKLCLVEQNHSSQNQKTRVPGFSPKYSSIWGRNMDTKHTTGKQITGN
jgi:hypothetical protein